MKNAREDLDFEIDGLLFRLVVSYDGLTIEEEHFWQAEIEKDGDASTTFWLAREPKLSAGGDDTRNWSCTARRASWRGFSLSVDGPDRDECIRACRGAAEHFSVDPTSDGLERSE